MGMTYLMLSLFTTICTSVITSYLYRAIFRPSGWTKKENEGVAVRFKVFLPLYLQNPEKWKLLPDAARYENTMVYFSTGRQWKKYNRWRKRVRKQRQKAEQEERQRKFMEAIFKEYEPEFATEKGEDCFIVKGGKGNPIVAVLPKPKDGLTNAELDKIRADLLYSQYSPEKIDAMIKQWADSKDLGINPMELAVQAAIEKYQAEKPNPRCKDCVHMRYQHDFNGRIDTVCVKHRTAIGFEPIWPEMTACGIFEERRREVRDYAKWAAARDKILHSVQTEQIPTSKHYE